MLFRDSVKSTIWYIQINFVRHVDIRLYRSVSLYFASVAGVGQRNYLVVKVEYNNDENSYTIVRMNPSSHTPSEIHTTNNSCVYLPRIPRSTFFYPHQQYYLSVLLYCSPPAHHLNTPPLLALLTRPTVSILLRY
jgi:hypothetical protein